MKCPKCEGELQTIQHEELIVDRCTNCQGLLMKSDMLRKMLAAPDSESYLDIGSEEKGKEFDKIEDIDCPVCNIAMDKMWDQVQTHIWKECCPRCGLTFLDAGEFTDLKYHTFSDIFKNFLKGTRG